MAHDRGCEITEIQPHKVTIERKERNSILLVQHFPIVSMSMDHRCQKRRGTLAHGLYMWSYTQLHVQIIAT
jgi:hypothetical protein